MEFVKYNHKLLIKGQSTGPSVSRPYQILLLVICGVNRTMNKTIWLDSSPPVDNLPDYPPDYPPDVNHDMVIKTYKDPDFTQLLSTPVNLSIGTPLYVELSVDKDKLSAGAHSKIIVENCFMLPSSNAANQIQIIKNQRALDEATDIFQSPALHKVQFMMETFKILYEKNLYLRCDCYVCPISDISARCNNPAANDQHKPGASKTADPTAPSSSGSSISVVSDGFGMLEPKLKKKPIYDSDDLPGLGPNDIVKIEEEQDGKPGKCYRIKPNGSIRLYHNPNLKPPQSPFGTKSEDPILNRCLNQS